METLKVETFYEDNGLKVLLEHDSSTYFVHIYISKYSLSTYKKCLAVMLNIKDYLLSMGVKHLFTYTENDKFTTTLIKTAKVVDEIWCNNKPKRVYVWELN